MTIQKQLTKMITALALIGFLTTGAMIGCGGGGGNGGGNDCDCEEKPIIEENGLVFTFEDQQVDLPANLSVFFKLDTRDGQPVTGLGTGDFMVYEDGDLISQYESQQTVVPMPGQFRSNTLLLLDLSGSIVASENLAALKTAAREFVFAVMDNGQGPAKSGMFMSVWWFDGARDIHPLVKDFSSDSSLLLDRIDDIDADISQDPSTNLYGAVIDGVDMVEAKVGTINDIVSVGSVVIFTDGADQAGWQSKEEALTAVENVKPGVSIYAIGLRGEIDESVLTAIGKDGAPFAEDVEQLTPRFEEIAHQIREDANSHYKLEYCSPKRKGSHDLMLKVNLDGLRGTLVTCFCAENFQGGCLVSAE